MMSAAETVQIGAGRILLVDKARLKEPDGVWDFGEVLKGTDMKSGEPKGVLKVWLIDYLQAYKRQEVIVCPLVVGLTRSIGEVL